MRKLIGSTVALTVLATSAVAADLRVRSAPPLTTPVSVYNWTGFYVGIEGGYGWGEARQTDPLLFNSGGYLVRGGLVGGTVGYNWQFNQLVVGLEGDYSFADIRGSTRGFCGGVIPRCSSNLESLGTFRGRIGWAGLLWWNSLMPYVTGGLAWGPLHGSEGDVLANGAVGSGTTTRAGWTLGAGIEAMLAPNWTAKLEYLYVDLGRGGVFNDLLPGGAVVTESIDFRASIFRAGLNYKFDWYRPLMR